jgi:ABC-type Fe3+-hydroxamate transport system substrate-binding protein
MPFLSEPYLPHTPQRIVSLVPSQTELLFHLGLEERVVGITKFCVHPASWFTSKPRVGGTKQVNLAAVKALQPDLIIANKEENVKEQVEALANIAPVYVTDVSTLAEALTMIQAVGQLTHTATAAQEITETISVKLADIQPFTQSIGVLYLIWKEPFMCAGTDTFISDILQHCGLRNLAPATRYPALTLEDITHINPPVVLLSSEPYPFKEKHLAELQLLLPSSKIMLVDGEMFSWYGSRLLYVPDYLRQFLPTLQA